MLFYYAENAAEVEELISNDPDLALQYSKIDDDLVIDKLLNPDGKLETVLNEQLIRNLLNADINLKSVMLSKLEKLQKKNTDIYNDYIDNYINIKTY